MEVIFICTSSTPSPEDRCRDRPRRIFLPQFAVSCEMCFLAAELTASTVGVYTLLFVLGTR